METEKGSIVKRREEDYWKEQKKTVRLKNVLAENLLLKMQEAQIVSMALMMGGGSSLDFGRCNNVPLRRLSVVKKNATLLNSRKES